MKGDKEERRQKARRRGRRKGKEKSEEAYRECWKCFEAVSWEEGSCSDIEGVFVENKDGDYQLRFAPIILPPVLK